MKLVLRRHHLRPALMSDNELQMDLVKVLVMQRLGLPDFVVTDGSYTIEGKDADPYVLDIMSTIRRRKKALDRGTLIRVVEQFTNTILANHMSDPDQKVRDHAHTMKGVVDAFRRKNIEMAMFNDKKRGPKEEPVDVDALLDNDSSADESGDPKDDV